MLCISNIMYIYVMYITLKFLKQCIKLFLISTHLNSISSFLLIIKLIFP